ncbi:peptidase C39-like protein [Saccharothrix carnea]|uniref:Peptidase C39-like protein n=1 Tax=Saccharothrix carnea TaxID=1280637 RepID=A0A2P8IDR5_SACCR|nr:C39 family peptidase [Saccharothrix carnea]PSL56604.1 peptidase C39-like protein [Saccharothrix carnea]
MKPLLRSLLLPVLVASALVGGAGVASAATATVGNTDGDGLNVRSAPTTASSSLGLVWDGQRVDISCQVRGQSVTNTRGFTSDLWDYVPALRGYLADAYLATGYDYRIPGVPDCGTSTGRLVPVSQFHGQPNQGEDCGPASVVSALLAAGKTPRSWNASRPIDAINRARADMGYDPSWNDPNKFGTNESDVKRALAANGVNATVVFNDLNRVLTHVRNGRPAIMAGNMVSLPWSGRNVPHFLTVAGYDGDYLVLDPASQAIVYRASASTLSAYFNHDLGRAGVLL